jgi:hypothetical protein
MTEEEWKAREIGRAGAMMNAAPHSSLEARMEWLEADASAQRTAILRLERDNRWHRVGLWDHLSYFAGLSLLLAINFPRLEMLP